MGARARYCLTRWRRGEKLGGNKFFNPFHVYDARFANGFENRMTAALLSFAQTLAFLVAGLGWPSTWLEGAP